MEDKNKTKTKYENYGCSSYRKDILIQVWVDSRKLATFTKWYFKKELALKVKGEGEDKSRGLKINTVPELATCIIDELNKKLVEKNEVEEVKFCYEAREILNRELEIPNVSNNKRKERNLFYNLQLDRKIKEAGENPVEESIVEKGKSKSPSKSPSPSPGSPEQILLKPLVSTKEWERITEKIRLKENETRLKENESER